MRDEQIREAIFVLEIHQQVDDLSLDGNVQSRDGLVSNDEAGIEGERSSDSGSTAI
jgi:hypothetical protein